MKHTNELHKHFEKFLEGTERNTNTLHTLNSIDEAMSAVATASDKESREAAIAHVTNLLLTLDREYIKAVCLAVRE